MTHHRSRRVSVSAVVAATLVVAGLVATAGPASAAVHLEVAPASGLTQNTVVEVMATGLEPNQSVLIGQCSEARTTCHGGPTLLADAVGSITTNALARVVMDIHWSPFAMPIVDCRLVACVMVLVDSATFVDFGSVPITFTSDADATPPAPTITPNDDLPGTATVTLDVPEGNLDPGMPITYGQCPIGLFELCESTLVYPETTDDRGRLTVEHDVAAAMPVTEYPLPFNCIPSACALTILINGGVFAEVPLHFAANPEPKLKFNAVGPERILDTRGGDGSGTLVDPIVVGEPRDFVITGEGIPESANVVVMNVTATNGTGGSYLKAWPTGAAEPTSSIINFGANQTIANTVTMGIGDGDAVTFSVESGAVDLVLDVMGYYDETGNFMLGAPHERLVDSRSTPGWDTPVAAGAPRTFAFPAAGGFGDASLVLNVTVTGATHGSYLSLYQTGSTPSTSSILNFGPGQTIANTAVVKVDTAGSITVANAVGEVDVIVDMLGMFNPVLGSYFHALPAPVRVLDSRVGNGLTGPWGPDETRTLDVLGDGIPQSATGIVMNTTVTNANAGSYALVQRTIDAATKAKSTINFGPGDTIANFAYSALDDGTVDIYNRNGSVHIIGDATGYFDAFVTTGERELTEPVDLCVPDGSVLNPDACGWSRVPLHRANLYEGLDAGVPLSDHPLFGRNKQWDYWAVLAGDLVVSAVYADIDHVGLADVYWVDLATGERGGHGIVAPAGVLSLPATPGAASLLVDRDGLDLRIVDDASGTRLTASWTERDGRAACLDVHVAQPDGHESLNVVIPWTEALFNFTSKHQARPAVGELVVGDRTVAIGSTGDAWGVLDVGRGRWPREITWNWGGGAGRCGEHVIGLQIGAKWTEGTGFTENGIIVDGHLSKLGAELSWDYDWDEPMTPWHVEDPGGQLDIVLTPRFDKHTQLAGRKRGSETHQVFGTWSGRLRTDDGVELSFHDLQGFAEEARQDW